MAYRRSLDFLPDVFKTEVNDKILSSTLDQLISEPELKRLGGYIGRQYSPVAASTDSYVQEISDLRQNYQLEPQTTYIDSDNKVRFTSSYVDLLRKIDALGGYINDHSRLFSSIVYNYDAFIDYDKFLNYSSYFWLPNGPDSVPVFATSIPLEKTYEVIPPTSYQLSNGQFEFELFDSIAFDISENPVVKVRQDGIKFDSAESKLNPTLRLARGGTYTFNLNQLGHGFYIQSQPGTNVSYDYQRNLSIREVFGTVNNGIDIGELIFNVPTADAQDFFVKMPIIDTADLIASSSKKNRALRFNEINNVLLADLISKHNGIDGQQNLNNKTIIFLEDPTTGQTPQPWIANTNYYEGNLITYNNVVYRVLNDYTTGRLFSENNLEVYDLQDNWYSSALYDSVDQPFDSERFDRGDSVDFEDRFSKFSVKINSAGYVILTPNNPIPKNNKITIAEGISYGNRYAYRDSNDTMSLVPPITANLDRLYYADAIDPNVGGIIEIIDQDNSLVINVDTEIIGKETYESPNGVKFTNGLKIQFLNDVVPSTYANKTYYVEGVGRSITLIDIDTLEIAETWLPVVQSAFDSNFFDAEAFAASTNAPTTPDYFVINRASLDKSAWSRQNRWFHKDVVELTAQYNNFNRIYNSDQRAKRPIIEFDPNLQLFNMGQIAKKSVDVIDLTNVDAFSTVEGLPVKISNEDSITFTGTADVVQNFKRGKELQGYSLIKETKIDDFITIEMKLGGTSTYYVDGIPLLPGMRVIFANDRDPDVRNKIYEVSWISPQSLTDDRSWSFTTVKDLTLYNIDFTVNDTSRLLVQIDGVLATDLGYNWSYLVIGTEQYIAFETAITENRNLTISLTFDKQIHLSPAEDAEVIEGDCVFIKQGFEYQGSSFYTKNNEWVYAQQKVKVNQPPLFDLFDKNGTSFSDPLKYASSNFVGNKLFGYAAGNSIVDPILGIKLKYRNLNNIGDIVFNDFMTTEKFIYKIGQNSVEQATVGSKVKQNFSDRTFKFRNQWTKIRDKSRQFQLQTYYATEYLRNLFPLNVIPAGAGLDQLSNIIVYVNNRLLYTNRYDLQKEGNNAYLLLDTDLNVGDKIDIKVYSSQIATDAVFSLPINYDFNPFNKEITEVTLGQMRNHVTNVIEDIPTLSDQRLSAENLRDSAQIKTYPGKILQNTGNPHIANFLMNDDTVNFFDSIIYAQREYTRFKNRFTELLNELAIAQENPALTVDRVLTEMAANKNKNFPFFTSDMIAFGDDYNLRTYTVVDNQLDTYDISEVVDMSLPNNKAILVYLNGTQLIINNQYTLNTTRPVLELNLNNVTLNAGDIIEIKEYTTTDGSYIPPTPTKLGLYPLYLPTVVTDGYGENTRSMIRGHDGSLTTIFNDFRDQAIIELELRIYNNIKVQYNKDRFDIWNYIPGAFRTTDYSFVEFTSILSTHFSAWSGLNGVPVSDYRQFVANDPFTYNYGRYTNRIDGNLMPASNWRGIYRYYFDTDAPDKRPWEMLGFNTEPNWWQDIYGQAPYTAGNQVLWNDLEIGYIAAGERKGIDEKFARPGLSTIIPVDESGELLSPLECISKDTDNLDVSGFYRFGDVGPVELTWRQSSEYPFVIQMAIALMKPAEYFNVNIDTNKQIIDLLDNQIIFSDTGLRDSSTQLFQNEIDASGNVVRKNSYTTWISEYCRSRGLDVTLFLGNRLRKLETRLGYKVGGFTDKKYLKIITEQYTPSSNNPTIIIPDDDFDVVLNKSAPINNLTYSGVIITKTVDGWSVVGYDDNKPYFMIEESEVNINRTFIKVGNLAVTKYNDGTGAFYRVPYGTEFFSIEQVGDFLISYGRYLTRMGFLFTDKDDVDSNYFKDWDLAVRQFLFYTQQGWGVDVAISLSPVGNKINYRGTFGMVDALTNRPLNTRALDENYNVIRSSEYTVYRNGRDFRLTVDDTRGIYLLDINVVEYENVIVFQNKTRFNDVIYEPIIGDRQYKLRLEGFKTADWDGSYGAAGFIINDDNVVEWQPGTNYNKGDIVLYKGSYFTAVEKIPASSDFELENWISTEYGSIKKGLLPNLSNRAGLFKKFYDTNDINLEEDNQLLGKELIGFEPRDYMADLNLSDTSQFKFYQGMLSQKGTISSFDKLLKAKLDNFGGTASIYEEWALRVGAYGATKSDANLQIELDEKWAVKDPLVIELLNDNDAKPTSHKGLIAKDLYIKEMPFDKNFLKNRQLRKYNSDLYSAGYAQFDDVDFISPTVAELNNYIPSTDVERGSIIWIAADRNNQWNVYRVTESEIKLKTIVVVGNGNGRVTCYNNHNLEQNDIIFVKQDNTAAVLALNGFYVVDQVIDSQTFMVKTGFGILNVPNLAAVTYKLSPMRFVNSNELVNKEPLLGWKSGDTIFVDELNENGWGVFENVSPWKAGQNYRSQTQLISDRYGASVATDPQNIYMIVGQPNYDANGTTGKVVLYSITNDGYLEERINLVPNSVGTAEFGFSTTASNDASFAAGAPASDDFGFVFTINQAPDSLEFWINQVLVPTTFDSGGEYGYAIKLSNDGNWLAVSQPSTYEGAVYIYQRRFVSIISTGYAEFTGNGITNIFVLTGKAAYPENAESCIVYQDGILLVPDSDYTVNKSTLVFSAIPAAGSKITVTVNKGNPIEEYLGDGSTVLFALTGDSAQPSSIYSLFVTVDEIIQVPFRDYTLELIGDEYFVQFTYAPDADLAIKISQRTHYELLTKFTDDASALGDRFGHSLSWSDNGRQLIVGAPGSELIGNDGSTIEADNSGKVYVYDLTHESFYSNNDSVFTTVGTIFGRPLVYVDNVRKLEDEDYTVDTSVNEIRFINPVPTGSIVKISTNQFRKTAELTTNDASDYSGNDTAFGYSVEICPTNCSVYIGCPGSDTGSSTDSGKVFRFVNQGRLFGEITGTIQNPVLTSASAFSINDFYIFLYEDNTLDSVVNAINEKNIPGIRASNENGYLKIVSDVAIAYEKLLIYQFSGTFISDMGLEIYVHQQTISSPTDDNYAEFGRSIKVAPSADILAIGSSKAPMIIETTIDNDKTYFDSRGTLIRDKVKQSGAVWLYQYLPVPYPSINNPGYFIPAQKLTTPKINTNDEFGIDIAINRNSIYVGAPGSDLLLENSGIVYSYQNINEQKIWSNKRSETPKVDTDLINRIFLYNKNSNQIVADLDFVDPFKGKILGLAAQEINYQTAYDPAGYSENSPSSVWAREKVGQVWWDISQARWIDYEQSNIATRASNWSSAFPGSKIICYEWVESNVPPAQYRNALDPTSFARSNRFNLVANIDQNTGVITNRYYFWVAGKRSIPNVPNRKYSTSAIESFIANPRGTNLPYAAFLSSNAIALYNVSSLLQEKNVVLNIDYDRQYNENSIHSEFQLIAENDANSIPNHRFIKKLIDSLAGIDDIGNKVPDINLTVGETYGIDFRPRQAMFRDRTYALKSAVKYINTVFASIPMLYKKNLDNLLDYERYVLPVTTDTIDTEIKIGDYVSVSGKIGIVESMFTYPNANLLVRYEDDTVESVATWAVVKLTEQELNIFYDEEVNNEIELTYLNIALFPENYRILVKSDSTISNRWVIYAKKDNNWIIKKIQAFDNRRYIQQIDWIKPGVADPIVTDYTIDNNYDLVTITPSLNDTVKIKNYNSNKYAVLQYTVDGWEIIKQELATFKIKDEIWNYLILSQGFSTETFDVQLFDDNPGNEIQKILTACYNDIFTDENQIEKNRWFLLMIKHTLAEQKYVDYAFKTSFIKVEHKNNQVISQIPSLQKDRQSSLQKYIEEVKPYHTKIREFVNNHSSLEPSQVALTDFDLPSYYNDFTKKYTSLTGKDVDDAAILERPEYQAWVNNHKFSLDRVLIAYPGIGYVANPTLTTPGNYGVQIETTVVNGELSNVRVLNKGYGFTTVPTISSNLNNDITIEGDGVTSSYTILPSISNNPETIPVVNISYNRKLIYNIDYTINELEITFKKPIPEKNIVKIFANAQLVPVMDNPSIRRIKDTIQFNRIPNNCGFLVQFRGSEDVIFGDGSSVAFPILYQTPVTASELTIIDLETEKRLKPFVDFDIDVDNNFVIFDSAVPSDKTYIILGKPVDIRDQRKSRIFGEHGVIDELLDALTDESAEGYNGRWLWYSAGPAPWPVPSVSEYRIFPEDSGRIQMQYTPRANGWSANTLQNYLRALGSYVGVDSLDISGTIVTFDGNCSWYQPTVLEWKPNTEYQSTDIIAHNSVAYKISPNYDSLLTGEFFDSAELVKINADEFESHINRTWVYYKPTAGLPGRDIGQLFKGIEYPGVVVQGPNFREEPGFDVGNYDMSKFDQYIIGPEGVAVLDPGVLDQTLYSNFLDTSLGTKPEDIITAGSGFVDTYSSHAPEEFIPGRVYDTLDIKVYTTPMSDLTGYDELGLMITLAAYRLEAGSTVNEYSFAPTVTQGDTIIVFLSSIGRLTLGVDYTVNYSQHTITLDSALITDTKIYIYAINGGGAGLIFDQEYVITQEDTNTLVLQADSNLINQSLVTLNGQRIPPNEYSIDFYELGVSKLTISNNYPLNLSDSVHVSLFSTESTTQQFVETITESYTVTNTSNYVITLTDPIGYSYPSDEKILVDLNNARLRPPAARYFDIGDGFATSYEVPYLNDVDINSITYASLAVSINGQELIAGIDYTLYNNDGSTWPYIVLTNPPPTNSLLTIMLKNKADYSIENANQIRLNSNLALELGDKVRVTHLTNNEKLGIRTSVYKGEIFDPESVAIGYDDIGFDSSTFDTETVVLVKLREYALSRPVTNINYVIATIDTDNEKGGQYLMPNEEFALIKDGTAIQLSQALTVLPNSTITITQFGEKVQQPAIGFRIFKDLNDNFTYLRLAGDAITKLTKPLALTDTEIFVENASVLPTPNLELSQPGIVMIGGERITYYGIDYGNNRLYNIRRGTGGTGAVSYLPAYSLVQDASLNQQIPDAHAKIWYNVKIDSLLPTELYAGLQNSTTIQAKFLLEKPTLLQSQVFDASYFTKGYAVAGYVEGNLY